MGSFRAEELPQGIQIFFRVYGIAQAVGGAGDGHQLFPGGAGFEILPAHITGNEVVVLSVEEDYRDRRAFQRFSGRTFIQVKVSEEPGTQLYEGIAELWRQLHLADDLLDDIPGGGEAAVCQNTDNIVRQRMTCCHHDGGGTHGDAGENDLPLREAADKVLQPGKAVFVLMNAKGDHISLGIAAAPLIYHQHGTAQSEAPLHTAGQSVNVVTATGAMTYGTPGTGEVATGWTVTV